MIVLKTWNTKICVSVNGKNKLQIAMSFLARLVQDGSKKWQFLKGTELLLMAAFVTCSPFRYHST